MKPNALIILAIGVLLLGGLFFVVKPQQTQNTQPAIPQTTSPSPTPEANIKTFDMVVKNKKIQGPEKTMTAYKGDVVVFKIVSDRAGEFHVHGYDKDVEVEENIPTELQITADLTGRFDIEFHEEDSEYEIGALEVLPK